VNSGWWPSPSATLGSGLPGSPRSSTGRSGVGSSSPPKGCTGVLRRHGLNTRAKRLGLVAGYSAPPEPEPRPEQPERHLDVSRPGEMVQMDCFFIGRLFGATGAVWQYAAIDVAAAHCWAPRRA
jgi:hypothetical protein